jgi:hypothetical protein
MENKMAEFPDVNPGYKDILLSKKSHMESGACIRNGCGFICCHKKICLPFQCASYVKRIHCSQDVGLYKLHCRILVYTFLQTPTSQLKFHIVDSRSSKIADEMSLPFNFKQMPGFFQDGSLSTLPENGITSATGFPRRKTIRVSPCSTSAIKPDTFLRKSVNVIVFIKMPPTYLNVHLKAHINVHFVKEFLGGVLGGHKQIGKPKI